MTNFLNNTNKELLWGVVCEHPQLKNTSVGSTQGMFQSLFYSFYEQEKNSGDNLMTLNKRFIIAFLTQFNTMQNMKTTTTTPPNNNEQQLITQQDIMNARKIEFEQNLQRQQNEFDRYRIQPTPVQPNFSETIDTPLHDSQTLLERTITQREMEYDTYIPRNNKSSMQSSMQPSTKGNDAELFQYHFKPTTTTTTPPVQNNKPVSLTIYDSYPENMSVNQHLKGKIIDLGNEENDGNNSTLQPLQNEYANLLTLIKTEFDNLHQKINYLTEVIQHGNVTRTLGSYSP